MLIDKNTYENRIARLEQELGEMTVALSQAWDQLVPFLQDMPPEAETTQDIEPILHTVAAAADMEFAGVYLYQADEWHSIPEENLFSPQMMQILASITEAQTLHLETQAGITMHWAFAPVVTENEQIGVLGIGTQHSARVFTAVDLRIVVRMAERIGHQITAAQLARLREKEMIRQHDLQVANQVQQSVQPVKPPRIDHVQMSAYWQPAREVGGDAWGWVQISEEQVTWFILDVSGKGLPAALAAVALHTAISMTLGMQLSPTKVLSVVNTYLYDAYTRTDLMATAAILSLNTRTGTLELANAGHPPILVRHQHEWLRFPATVPPLGVLPDLEPQMQNLTLASDDIIIAYSDGFTEIQTEKRLWGQTGLLNAVPERTNKAETITQNIVSASQRVGSIEDDQTLVTTVWSAHP